MKEIKELNDFSGSDGYLAVDGLNNESAGGKKKLSDIQPLVLHAVTEEDPENPGNYWSYINYSFDDLLTKVKGGTPLTVIIDGPINTEYHDNNPYLPKVNYTYVISEFQIIESAGDATIPPNRRLIGTTGKSNEVHLIEMQSAGNIIPLYFVPGSFTLDVSNWEYNWPSEQIGWSRKWARQSPKCLELLCNGMSTIANYIAYLDGNNYYSCYQCRHENGAYSLSTSPIIFYYDWNEDTMHGTFPFFSDQ